MLLNTKSDVFTGFGNAELSSFISGSGMAVTYDTALQDATVKACIRVIAQTIATLPLKLYKKQIQAIGKDWVVDDNSLMSTILTQRPNVRQTSVEFVEQMITQLMVYSEFFAIIRRTPNGKISALIPFNSPKQVSIHEAGENIVYKCITNDNKSLTCVNDEIFHIRDLSLNTFTSIDKISQAKSSIGLSLAATHNAESYYKRGPRAGAFIQADGKLTDDSFNRLSKQFNEAYAGNDAAHKIAILENGMKYVPNQYSLKDAQVLESRNAAIREIAAIFGVPVSLLGISDPNLKDVESINAFFYKSCLQSIINKIEARFRLMLPNGYALKFDTAEYLRGDTKTVSEIAQKLFERGLISHGEAREMVGRQTVNPDLWVIGSNNLAFGKLEQMGTANPTLQDDPVSN